MCMRLSLFFLPRRDQVCVALVKCPFSIPPSQNTWGHAPFDISVYPDSSLNPAPYSWQNLIAQIDRKKQENHMVIATNDQEFSLKISL